MGEKNLEGKSNVKFKNSGKIILNYEDFADVRNGNYLALSMSGKNNNYQLSKMFPKCTTTFFKKREIIDEEFQKIFLHHNERTSDQLYSGRKPMVVGYILPRNGKLELKNFIEGELKKPNINDSDKLKK